MRRLRVPRAEINLSSSALSLGPGNPRMRILQDPTADVNVVDLTVDLAGSMTDSI